MVCEVKTVAKRGEKLVEMRFVYPRARELEFPRSKSYDDETIEVGCSARFKPSVGQFQLSGFNVLASKVQ
jgi:hypothetical protein